MKILTQPIFGAEPLMCIDNVEKRIRACGGGKMFGWRVKRNGPVTVQENHVVWKDEAGRLFDVTPEFAAVEGEFVTWEWPQEVEFVPDDRATFSGRDDVQPHRYVSDDPRLDKALEYLGRGDHALHHLDLDGCRYWTQKANHAAKRFGLSWEWPVKLEMADLIRTTL